MVYIQKEEIGAGGFAKVFLVEFSNGELGAKKILHPNQRVELSPQDLENITARFRREVITLTSINHPNVVKILGSNLDNDPPSYLMPLAESTLARDMTSLKKMPIEHRIGVFMDILAGLEAIHELGIYHRDLKPLNILRFGSNYAISDFGLISLDQSQLSVLTQSGVYMGSDKYTAPEITHELKYASKASDIYSAGCLLHDLTTSGSGVRIPCNQISDPENPYEDILKICTRKDKNGRFQNVRDLREAISSIIIDEENLLTTNSDILQDLEILNNPETTSDIDFLEKFLSTLENTSDKSAILLKIATPAIDNFLSSKDENLISRFIYIYTHLGSAITPSTLLRVTLLPQG